MVRSRLTHGPVNARSIALIGVAALALVVSFYLPVSALAGGGGNGLSEVAREARAYLGDPLFWRTASISFGISLAVTAACMVIAVPVAAFLAHARAIVERILASVVVASLFSSILLRTFVWFVLLGREGPIIATIRWLNPASDPTLLFSSFAVVVGMVHILLPMSVLVLWFQARATARVQHRLASGFAASDWYYLVRIFLPSNLKTIIETAALIFVLAFGFYITPLLLGGGTGSTMMLGVLIDEQVNRFGNWPKAAALSLLMLGLLAVSVILLLIVVWTVRFRRGAANA